MEHLVRERGHQALVQCVTSLPSRVNVIRCFLGLFLLAGFACKKRRVEAAPPPLVAPAPAKEVSADVALHHLNTAVRDYYAEKLKFPASLDEVYAAGYLKERYNPPVGRQYVINPQSKAVELR